MNGNVQRSYISCIKINGVPILPPLITPERKKEVLQYKQRAINLENIKKCRRNIQELSQTLENSSARPSSQLSFDSSHLEALAIHDNPKNSPKNNNLTLNIVEVTQYDNTGVRSFNNTKECDEESVNDCTTEKLDNSTALTVNNTIIETKSIKENECTPKPRIIRSNSYTLESPSPILLAHLKNNPNSINGPVRRNSFENRSSSLESSDFSSLNTVYNKKTSNKEPKEQISSPTIEVYQTDISVQQITVNTLNDDFNSPNKKEKFLLRNPFDVLEPDQELLKILKDIPKEIADQVIEIINKQHTEQKERLERYDKLNSSLETAPDVLKESNDHRPCTAEDLTKLEESGKTTRQNSNLSSEDDYSESNPKERLTRSSTFSVSPSQSLFYSITSDTVTAPSTPSLKLVDLEPSEPLEIGGVLLENDGYWEGVTVNKNAKNLVCNRELFPVIDNINMNNIKRKWAASVIGAHVKGYLTRRLLNTEKVQSLIATIKDVLVCALDLHRSATIDEKDVELHRRLINQLSATLYAFHEIFFDLSVQEQMSIIATDRTRKILKQKEPKSRPQSGRNSIRSSKSTGSIVSNASENSSRKLIGGTSSLTKV